MKNLVLSAALVTGAMVGATAASATTLSYNGLAGYGYVSVSNADATDTTNNYSGAGGAFKMGDQNNELGLGNNFIAFCLDLAGTVKNGYDYVINNVNPFQPGRELSALQRQNVELLYDASFGLVDTNNNIDAAAFQLVLWEAGYETEAGPLSLTDGTRLGTSGNADILARANTFLANMASWDGIDRFNVNFLDADVDARQDLVMATPVPVPAAGLLMLTGLGGIAAMRRRKKS